MNRKPSVTPEWVERLIGGATERRAPEGLMSLAIRLALENARRGGGPFGAVVADHNCKIVAVGWNNVIPSNDSTAHAEINSLRRAQLRLETHDLSSAGEFCLYSSCAPCIQCFGAIYWSGLRRVYAASDKESAEALGFDEGPVSRLLWQEAAEKKGIEYIPDFTGGADATAPFLEYRERSGKVY